MSVCVTARCGDGVIYAGREECDDANDTDGDACTTACVAARCGDGIVHVGQEECDDGNDVDLDPCRSGCILNQVPQVTAVRIDAAQATVGTVLMCAGTASDPEQDPVELMYTWLVDGVLVGNGPRHTVAAPPGSILICRVTATDAIDWSPPREASIVIGHRCGDATIQAGVEARDDGNDDNGDQCLNSCEAAAAEMACAGGVEQCDDGNDIDTDRCSSR